MGPITPRELAVFVLCIVLVCVIDGYQERRKDTNRRNARRLSALRGFDPYEADFDWRRNRGTS